MAFFAAAKTVEVYYALYYYTKGFHFALRVVANVLNVFERQTDFGFAICRWKALGGSLIIIGILHIKIIHMGRF